mmetsp:Transcript_45847/g.127798  ORF Transcript_45847/g.127798 Transcript_45847/m.127798 type:complete len:82 (+) Transcript_45847:503-748(+)
MCLCEALQTSGQLAKRFFAASSKTNRHVGRWPPRTHSASQPRAFGCVVLVAAMSFKLGFSIQPVSASAQAAQTGHLRSTRP